MAYIGNPPISGNFQVCDAISVVNGQAGYTMQVSSANVSPETANHMLVSLNGVLQKPNSSFTISGSTITFASNLVTNDVIDFILLLGNVNDIGTPSDATVTNAKTNFTTTSSGAGLKIKGDGTTAGALQLNCEANSHGIKLQSPAHSANQSYTIKFPTGNITADRFLKVASVSGSGTTGVGQLSFAEAGGGGLVHLQTQTISSGVASVDFTSNIDSTYASYKLVVSDLRVATDNVEVKIRLGAGSFASANYTRAGIGRESNGTTNTGNGDNNSNGIYLTTVNLGNAADESMSFECILANPSNTDAHKLLYGTASYLNQHNRFAVFMFGGHYNANTAAVTRMQVITDSGNIDGGVFTLFGIAKS